VFDVLVQILPLILIFLFGFGLKQAKLLTTDDGSSLLKVIFYAGLPPLIFLSVLKVSTDVSLIWLCLLPPTVITLTLAATFLLRRSLLTKLDHKTFGALLSGAVIMNTGFLLPFVDKLYGAEGLARLAIIDTFNALITFSVVYAIVVKIGDHKPDHAFVWKKILLSPPLWALVIGLACKASGVVPPPVVIETFGSIAKLVAPVLLIALGLKFTLRVKNPKLLLVPLLLRFVGGAIIGILFVKLLGLEGVNAEIVLLASIAPIGFNSITFAELEKLDVEFAASQVSVGIVIAMITVPFIVQLLSLL